MYLDSAGTVSEGLHPCSSISLSLSVVLGSFCDLSIGKSLGFLRVWQPLNSQSLYMATEDIKGEITPDSMAEVGSPMRSCMCHFYHILLVATER